MEQYYKKFLEENRYPRQLKSLERFQGFNFSSSDYLNLANHPLLIQRSHEFAKRYGVGTSSSRLVTGNLPIFTEIEEKLAIALNKPAALIFGTGYQTNVSVLEALLDPKILGVKPKVYCDRLCHISLMKSPFTLSDMIRFHHNDLNHLESLLKKDITSYAPKFIIVESVYSMDGDQADLSSLIQLAKQYQAFLYVDDAHSTGLLGKSGWGSATDFSSDIPLIMGTFSKALGSFGGYVGCSQTLRDFFINKCKGLIYSTGLPPAILGAISASIELMPALDLERDKVFRHAKKVREFFINNRLDCGTSSTHIIPWIIGDSKKTVIASQYLLEEGIIGTAIQPPTVPANRCRIRFCLSARHTDQEIDYLLKTIQKVAKSL